MTKYIAIKRKNNYQACKVTTKDPLLALKLSRSYDIITVKSYERK